MEASADHLLKAGAPRLIADLASGEALQDDADRPRVGEPARQVGAVQATTEGQTTQSHPV
jgi:hypothetical protein